MLHAQEDELNFNEADNLAPQAIEDLSETHFLVRFTSACHHLQASHDRKLLGSNQIERELQ
jgi:hypothetical protein